MGTHSEFFHRIRVFSSAAKRFEEATRVALCLGSFRSLSDEQSDEVNYCRILKSSSRHDELTKAVPFTAAQARHQISGISYQISLHPPLYYSVGCHRSYG